ncbi:hypothetical protein D3C76_1479870 [compost metagenome]
MVAISQFLQNVVVIYQHISACVRNISAIANCQHQGIDSWIERNVISIFSCRGPLTQTNRDSMMQIIQMKGVDEHDRYSTTCTPIE